MVVKLCMCDTHVLQEKITGKLSSAMLLVLQQCNWTKVLRTIDDFFCLDVYRK